MRIMTGEQYKASIHSMGLTHEKAGEFLGASFRSSVRWADEGPPASVAILLRVMAAKELSTEYVEQILAYPETT